MTVSHDEFAMLWRYLNTDSFDHEKVELVFGSKADKEQDGDTVMSYERFCSVAAEMGLFTEEKQCAFIGVKDRHQCKDTYKVLRQNWTKMKETFKKAIVTIADETGNLDWDYIVDSLDDRMLKCDEKEMPALLISTRMLECELIRAIEDVGKDSTILTKPDYQVFS